MRVAPCRWTGSAATRSVHCRTMPDAGEDQVVAPREAVGSDDDPAALRAEVTRLRALVGPGEQSYDDLRQDLLAARDAARGADAEAGVLRGQLAQLHVELARARQDQDHLQRMLLAGIRSLGGRFGRSARTRFF